MELFLVLLTCVFAMFFWCFSFRSTIVNNGSAIAGSIRQSNVLVLSEEEIEGYEEPKTYVQNLLHKNRSLRDVVIRGMSPLNYFLALYDDEFACSILKEGKGNDIQATLTGGFTALHFASDHDMLEAVRLLLEHKADTEATTEDLRVVGHYDSGGRTPLHLASIKGHNKVVSVLLASGANPNAKDFDGNTPFVLACMSQHFLTSRLLEKAEPFPSSEWLLEKARADRANAMMRSKEDLNPKCSLMKVHILSVLWSHEECQCVLKEVSAVTNEMGWTANRHRAYATTDIQSCQIPKIDAWVRQTLRTRLFPRLIQLYFPGANIELSFRDLFFVKYSMDGQKGLSIHLDGSLLSFNLLLNPAYEFTGGGTYIEHLDKTFNITEGDCFVHSGRIRHAGASLTSGVRYLLVGFVDVRLPGSQSLRSDDLTKVAPTMPLNSI